MEPNQQTVQNNNPPIAETNNQPATNPTPVENTAVQDDPKKKSSKTGVILGFVLLFLLAAGGIGFGVWAMMDGNTQKEQLNSQINTLKKQNEQLLDQIEKSDSADKEEKEGEKDDAETVELSRWPVSAATVFGRFVVFNEDFEIIAKNDDVKIMDVFSCDTPVGPDAELVLKCTVNLYDTKGQGAFVYNGKDGSLNYTPIAN